MDTQELEALNAVLNYMLPEEKKHWEESMKPKKHIYHDLRTLQKYAADIEDDWEEGERSWE